MVPECLMHHCSFKALCCSSSLSLYPSFLCCQSESVCVEESVPVYYTVNRLFLWGTFYIQWHLCDNFSAERLHYTFSLFLRLLPPISCRGLRKWASQYLRGSYFPPSRPPSLPAFLPPWAVMRYRAGDFIMCIASRCFGKSQLLHSKHAAAPYTVRLTEGCSCFCCSHSHVQ